MKINNKNIIWDKFKNWIINFNGISFNKFISKIFIIKSDAKKLVLTDLNVGANSSANSGIFNSEKIKINIRLKINNRIKISFLFKEIEYEIFS